MELEKKKFIVAILMLLLIAVSTGVSIGSYIVSKNAEKRANEAIEKSEDSNKIAEEALETNRYQFIQVNRPYLIVSPKKYDNGQFWQVSQEENVVVVRLKYKIENVGNIAAKDIKLPDKVTAGPKMNLKEGTPIYYRKMGKITIGPGDSYVANAEIMMGYESTEEAKTNVEHFISPESEGITIQIPVNYTNELDSSQKYRTFMMNKIHNDKSQIIKSEMLNFSGDLDD